MRASSSPSAASPPARWATGFAGSPTAAWPPGGPHRRRRGPPPRQPGRRSPARTRSRSGFRAPTESRSSPTSRWAASRTATCSLASRRRRSSSPSAVTAPTRPSRSRSGCRCSSPRSPVSITARCSSSHALSSTRSPSCGASRQASGFREIADDLLQVVVALGVLAQVGAQLDRADQVPQGVLVSPCLRLHAREVVEELRPLAEPPDPVLQRRDPLLRLLLVRLEEPLPARRLERLVRPAADGEDGRPLLLGPRNALERRVADEDDRPGGRVELLAADGERRPAGEDDVDLLVAALLGVLLDHPVTWLRGGVGVHPECADAESPRDRPPLQPVRDRDAREVVDACDLEARLSHR